MFKSINITIGFFLLFSVVTSAQTTNVWRGGAPGHETDWSYYKNWSKGRVPSVFDNVIIPNISSSTGEYPVISKGEVEVWSLEIQPEASLTLMPEARLLLEYVQVYGACKGCEQRILIEGTVGAAAYTPKPRN